MKTIKIVLIGDTAVGKTWLITTFLTNETPNGYVTTIFDNFGKQVKYKDEYYTLSIWDTAGIKECNKMSSVSYQQADIFVVCFAINCTDSYKNAKKFLQTLQEYDVPLLLCGTKCDRSDQRTVEENVARNLAKKYRSKYIETSSVEFTNVSRLFDLAIEIAISPKTTHNNKCYRLLFCCK